MSLHELFTLSVCPIKFPLLYTANESPLALTSRSFTSACFIKLFLNMGFLFFVASSVPLLQCLFYSIFSAGNRGRHFRATKYSVFTLYLCFKFIFFFFNPNDSLSSTMRAFFCFTLYFDYFFVFFF